MTLLRVRLLLLAVFVGAGSLQLFLDGWLHDDWMVAANIICGLFAFSASVIFVSSLFRIHRIDGKFYYDARNPLWRLIKPANPAEKKISLCAAYWQIFLLTVLIAFVVTALSVTTMGVVRGIQDRKLQSLTAEDLGVCGLILGASVLATTILFFTIRGLVWLAEKFRAARIVLKIFWFTTIAAAAVLFLVLLPIGMQLKANIFLSAAVQNDLFGLVALDLSVLLVVLALKLFKVLRNTAFGEWLANELCPILEELPGTQS